MAWYAVLCDSRREHVADKAIKGLGHRTLFLHQLRRSHRRGAAEVKASIFPRYLFVEPRHDGFDLREILFLAGVAEIVPSIKAPIQIPELVIEELRSRGDADGLVATPPIRVGDRYKIGRLSPLAGLVAEIASLPDPSGRLRAFVRLFGGPVSVRLNVAELEEKAAG